jgi:hypothetical protein
MSKEKEKGAQFGAFIPLKTTNNFRVLGPEKDTA